MDESKPCPDEVVLMKVDWLFLESFCKWRHGTWDISRGGDGEDNYFYCNHYRVYRDHGGTECGVKICPLWDV